jgi:hypothetical protein
MVILEILGNIVTSILIGYLALTNVLAEKIELLLPAPEEEVLEEDLGEDGIEDLGEGETLGQRLIPRVLLDHLEFQKAAVIASQRDEEPVIVPEDQPLSEVVKDALVNVYCQYTTDRFIRTTTGTGFFINQKGVILTNAHVAQFLILEDAENIDGDVECVIRSGDPAEPKYTAELLYISPAWIVENAGLITDEAPRGTGERDYALLYISKSVDGSPLPVEFPAIPVNVDLLTRNIAGSSVMTAGYPAEALFRSGADAALAPVVALTTVGTLYTFGSNYADIFSVSESPVGEQGASGGPIVTEEDRDVIGIIVTKGDEATEGTHSLRAITLSYIDRTIIEETGFTLQENMQGDPAFRGGVFKTAMLPFLVTVLEEELTGTN